MMTGQTFLKTLLGDTRGTSAVEYGLICAVIVVGLISAVKGLGDANSGLWDTVSSKSAAAQASNAP